MMGSTSGSTSCLPSTKADISRGDDPMRLRSLLSQAVFMAKTVAVGNVVREYVSSYAYHTASRDVAPARFRFATPSHFHRFGRGRRSPLQQTGNWTERLLLEH